MMLQPGTMLQERYEILEKIGSGGMSEVYKAKCHKLNRLVAIKVLKTEFISDATFVSKFKMEAQAAAGLSHPNIVSIYDVVDEGEIHFIVMELVEGITLKSYILKKGRLESKEAIGIAIQVAQGIEAAHEQHIIHRDIKPQNMLISRDGKVKVADFGIARAVSSQTMSSNVVGSVHYISPEQARGGYSDERSDLYSLGITMFEMVTGKLPFEGENTVTVALAHLEEPITFPSTYNPEVSPSFERIILKCTEKRPEKRYASAAEVITDLRRALLNPDDPVITIMGSDGSEGAAGIRDLRDTGEVVSDTDSATREITPRELTIIQGRTRTEVSPGGSGRDRIGGQETGGETQGKGRRAHSFKRKKGTDDETTQLEKLLTALGVIAAVILVAVLLLFFTRLGGLFSSKTPEEQTTELSEDTTAQAEDATLSQKEVLMPSVVGDTQEEAEKKLEDLDLVMQVKQESSDEVEKGIVISQETPEGTVVSRYSKVVVVVSEGSNKIELSDLGLTGMTLENAVSLLEGKGLKTAVTEEASETVEKGVIIRVEPEDLAAPGDTVMFYVSSGPEDQLIAVPQLVGKSEEAAEELIADAGLNSGEISEEYSSSVAAGLVISQKIAADTQVEPGTSLDFTLSLGPKPVQKQFIASLDASYPLTVSFGPGAGSAQVQILIRLKQKVNGQDVYTKLTDIKSYSSDTTLDIHLDKIRGADGVTTGEVEIVDLTNNVILTSYNVTFTETEVSE